MGPRALLALIVLGLAAARAGAAVAPSGAEEVEFLGFWKLAPPGEEWKIHDGQLSLVPDCLGRPDPTPDDGWPGCMLTVPKIGPRQNNQVGLVDIPRPALPPVTSETLPRAQWVIEPWTLTGAIEIEQGLSGSHTRIFDILYERESGECRIWWAFQSFYANGARDTTPWLGVSSCDPEHPKARGLWGWSSNRASGYGNGPNMYGRGLFLVPHEYVGALGGRLALGPGKGTGTRGSAHGPSMAVRPLTIPADGTLNDTRVDLLYFPPVKGGYPSWSIPEWWEDANMLAGNENGQEIIGDTLWAALPRGEPMPDRYPASEGPCGTMYHPPGPGCPEGGPGWKKIYPPPHLAPEWYGISRCREDGSAASQWPRFQELASDGSHMPADCKIVSDCPSGTGPKANNRHMWLYGIRIADILAAKKPWLVKPTVKIDIGFWTLSGTRESCRQSVSGTTADHARRILYVNDGSMHARVHVYRIHERGASSPPTASSTLGPGGAAPTATPPATARGPAAAAVIP